MNALLISSFLLLTAQAPKATLSDELPDPCSPMDQLVTVLESEKVWLYYKTSISTDSVTGRDCHTSTITVTPGGTGYLYTNGIGYVGNAYEESIKTGLTLDAAKALFNQYMVKLQGCYWSKELAMAESLDETLHADNFTTYNDYGGEWHTVCLDIFKDDAGGTYEVWMSIDYFMPY